MFDFFIIFFYFFFQAITYHTHHYDLVVAGQKEYDEGTAGGLEQETLNKELVAASFELNKMYKTKAEKLEATQKLKEAIILYERGKQYYYF